MPRIKRSTLPPGPRGRLRPTIQLLRDPLKHFAKWAARYGDPFTVASPSGYLIETWEPENARALFTANHDQFAVFGPETIEPLIGARSVLLLVGKEHRRERRLLGPPFHGARMRAYGEAMVETTGAAIAGLGAGDRLVGMELTQSISLEVIIRTVFGVASTAEVDAYKATILAAIESASPLIFFFPALRHEFGGVGPFARLKAAQGRFIELLRRQIAAVRPRAAEREDILSMMLEARYDDGAPMRDAAIVDELRTLLLAGHETTALSLAWALDLVHRDRAVYERLIAEIDALGPAPSPEAVAAAPYLEAVCQETLRLYPIVLEVMRTLTRPLTFAGRDLPAGVTVAVNILLAHRRPETYPEPEVFRPQRFLERTFSPFEFMPFGGGPRRCVGAAFALYEMKLVLATILRELELELEDPGPPTPVRRNLTMAPKGGVRMRVRRRRGVSARGPAVAP